MVDGADTMVKRILQNRVVEVADVPHVGARYPEANEDSV